jgi:hypothetical protein
MDQLFKALPRDLQWEVLSEFVGTHVVRNGKLMRKIVYFKFPGSTFREMGKYAVNVDGLSRVRPCYKWLHDRGDDIQHCVRFYGEQRVIFCEDVLSRKTIICYRKIIDGLPLWEVHFTPDLIDEPSNIPPFVKHDYPSYPFTDKKRRIPLIRWIYVYKLNLI